MHYDRSIYLTGQTEIDDVALPVPFSTIGPKAYIFSTDLNGNPNWSKEYAENPDTESYLYDIEVHCGAIYGIGGCNERYFTDPESPGVSIVKSQNFDVYRNKTNLLGELSSDKCYTDISFKHNKANVPIKLAPTRSLSECFEGSDPGLVGELDCVVECCTNSIGCQISSTLQIDNQVDYPCCYLLDLNNVSISSQAASIQVDITNPVGVFFDQSSIITSLNLANYTSTSLTIDNNGMLLPNGNTNGYVKFCFGNSGTLATNQTFTIKYFDINGNELLDCEQEFNKDCELPPTDKGCVEVTEINVECDSLNYGQFKFTYQVTNQTTNYILDALQFTVVNPATGIILPTTINPILAPIGSSQTSIDQCIDIYDVTSGSYPKQVDIIFGANGYHQSDQTLFCCHDRLDTLSIILPECTNCIDIVDHHVYCDNNGDYYLDFCVENNSTPLFMADELDIAKLSSTPPSIGLSQYLWNNSTNSGSFPITGTFCETVKIIGVSPQAGDMIDLEFRLNNFALDSCCIEREILNITLPNCCDELVIDGDFDDQMGTSFTSSLSKNCSCAAASWCIETDALNKCAASGLPSVIAPTGCSPSFLIVEGTEGTIWSQPVDIIQGECYEFSFQYYPNTIGGAQPDLNIVVGLDIIGSTTGVPDNWTSYTYNYTAPSTGTFNLSIVQTNSLSFNGYGIDCISFDCVPCSSECCTNYEAFCDRIDAGFKLAFNNPSNCTVGVSPLGLNECDQVRWSWGDGTTSSGTWNTSVTHTYPSSGIYVVCMMVRETDDNGEVCWEKEFCREVKACILRPPCESLIDLGSSKPSTGVIQAENTIISSGSVLPNTCVDFKAGEEIILNNNFSIEKGATFFADIESCYCDLPAPENLIVDSVDVNNMYLSWIPVNGATQYYIEYVVDGGAPTYHYTTTNNIVIPFDQGVDHQYTIFTDCGENGSQGSTIGFTYSDGCFDCDPVENVEIYWDEDGNLVITWEGGDNASSVNFDFYGVDGNEIIGNTTSPGDSSIIVISPKDFPGGEFPSDDFEVVITVSCDSDTTAKRMSSGCHPSYGLIIVIGEVVRHTYYCNNPHKLKGYITICCEHLKGATPNEFINHCH